MTARSSLAKFARAYAAQNPAVVGRAKPPKVRGVSDSKKRDLEGEFALMLRAHEIGGASPQYRFHPTRLWRFDFAWPRAKFAVEIHGQLFNGKKGGHSTPSGIRADFEKDTAALLLGWRVFRIHSDMVLKQITMDVVRMYVGDGSGEDAPPDQTDLRLE